MRLIDADALFELMCERCDIEHGNEPCEPNDCVYYQAILNAPTVEPKRESGHWAVSKFATSFGNYICDRCEMSAPWAITRDRQILSDFCPHCGADMRGDKE